MVNHFQGGGEGRHAGAMKGLCEGGNNRAGIIHHAHWRDARKTVACRMCTRWCTDAPAKVGGGGAMAANAIICNDLACRCSPVPLFTMINGHGPGGAGREIQ